MDRYNAARSARGGGGGGPYNNRGGGQRGGGGNGSNRFGGGGGNNNNGDKPKICHRCGAEGHVASMCTAEKSLARNEDYESHLPRLPHHATSFIDTHCHVDYMCESARVSKWSEFKAAHPMPSTYAGCITTYCDPTAIVSAFSQFEDLEMNHPEVYHTFGLHPHNARYWNDRIENRLVEMSSHPRCVGFGEIGIDVTSEKKGGSEQADQVSIFMRQLEIASQFVPEKPIVIHYRGDGETLFEFLRPLPAASQKLHLHCWGDPSVDLMQRLSDAYPKLCFGFTGLICDNAKLRPILQNVGINRFVLETDGPYMLPKTLLPPKGSKILAPVNHPGRIPFVAEAIGKAKGMSTDRVLDQALKNTGKLYGIGPYASKLSSSSAASPASKVDPDAASATASPQDALPSDTSASPAKDDEPNTTEAEEEETEKKKEPSSEDDPDREYSFDVPEQDEEQEEDDA